MNTTPTQAFSEPMDAHRAVEAFSQNASSQFSQMAQVEAMLGGKAPYDDAELRNSGHAEMLNVNFRSGRLRVRRLFRRFLDLLVSPPRAVNVRFKKWDEESTRVDAQNELAEALSHAMRSCDVMETRRHRLRDMVRLGAGFAYFPKAGHPTPRFLSRASVLLPMDASASPKGWSICAIHDEIKPVEIIRLLDRIRAGMPDGWVERGLQLAAWHAQNRDVLTDDRAFNVEKAVATENKIRLNSFGSTYSDTDPVTIPISRVYVRNDDGQVDLYIVERHEGVSEWLCKKTNVAECFSELLYPLYYQEDEHLYWMIEGFGQDIFNAEMLKDQNRNATADAVSLAMRPILKTGSAGKRSNPVVVDRFIQLEQDEEMDFSAMRGDTINPPVLLDTVLSRDLEAMANGTSPSTNVSSVQPISAAEARVENIEFTEQNTVAADFIYEQEQELAEEICERLLAYEKSEIDPDEEGEEFLKAIRKSIHWKASLYKPENVEITLYRSVGAGSGRDRRNALGVGFQARGALDPIGQKQITKDFFVELFGKDHADRYVRMGDERQTPTTNGQHAHLENAVFKGGTPLPTPVDDNHGIHLPIHLNFLIEVVKAGMQAEAQQAQFNSPAMLATFDAALPHVAQHLDLFVAGANTAELKKQADDFTSALSQVTNYYQRIQKRVKDEQIAQAKEAERQQIAAMQERAGIQRQMESMQAEIQKMRSDTSIQAQRAQGELRIKQDQSERQMAIAEREAERRANLPTTR